MSFKKKWLKKLHALCANNFHIRLSNAEDAISYFVSIANLNWIEPVMVLLQEDHRITTMILQMWMLLEDKLEMQEFKTIMQLEISKICPLKELQDTMFAVQIVKKEDNFYKISTKFWKIVSIFVNSHTSAILKTERKEVLYGRLWSSFKNMPCMNVLNLVVISAIKKNSSTWQEHSFSIILKLNAQKLWSNVQLVVWNLQEVNMLLTNA